MALNRGPVVITRNEKTMYSIFVCEAYFTPQVEQIEALNESQAIEIFKEMTGESVVSCTQIA